MPKRSSTNTKKLIRDVNQANSIARSVADLTSGHSVIEDDAREKNPAAVALGRLGGLKGGKARAEKLSPRKRKQIAKRAALARWSVRT